MERGMTLCHRSRRATLLVRTAHLLACSSGETSPMSLTRPQLKRTLRQLRQLELTLRFGRASAAAADHPALVWDVFFSTKDSTRGAGSQSVKYPLSHLLQLEREAFKAILDEYFARIYAQTAQDHGLTQADVYDPQLLARLGLPPYAGGSEIKRQFRALAKQYHPDLGGDSAQFVELVTLYEQLTEGSGEEHGGGSG